MNFYTESFKLRLQIFLIIILSVLFLFGMFISLKENIQSEGELRFTKEQPIADRIFQNLVYVSGEVKNPGTYEFIEGMRINQLIELAGGFTKLADQNNIAKNINLSERVEDEQHIFIPSVIEEISDSKITSQTDSNSSDLININNATSDILDTLPGVGPATAERIISNRPYAAIDELLNVSGIGEAKYSQIKDLITI